MAKVLGNELTDFPEYQSNTHVQPSGLLKGIILYVTIEPCLMCAWALRLLSIDKVSI
jgi:tRNA(Arg) A34 adenosine deaminase TadA